MSTQPRESNALGNAATLMLVAPMLTAAESRLFQALASDQGAVQFRVLAGRFKREQEAAFRRTMNPQMLAQKTPPTHRVRRHSVNATS